MPNGLKTLNRLLSPIRTTLQLMVSRVVILGIRWAPKLPTAQLTGLSGEILEGVEVFGHYGFTSHPKPNAEGIAVSVGGIRDHMVLIATADRTVKITLAEGEVALIDDLGQKVHLTRSGIVINTSLKVTVNAGGDVDVDAGGNVEIDAVGDATINAGGVVNLGGTGGVGVCRIGDDDNQGDSMVQGSAKVLAV